ncbi:MULTISPECIES: hypothetical protein [unclassified Frankia]
MLLSALSTRWAYYRPSTGGKVVWCSLPLLARTKVAVGDAEPLPSRQRSTAPTLIVHDTKDTFISVDASRAAVGRFRVEPRLVEIERAQHGFAVHDDPAYADPQSKVTRSAPTYRGAPAAAGLRQR